MDRFLHDLVLAIGGMTVTELKDRMSIEELSAWLAYTRECGPINPSIRIDAAVARAVQPFLKGDPETIIKSLMPWPKEPEREATVEDFMNILKAAKKT